MNDRRRWVLGVVTASVWLLGACGSGTPSVTPSTSDSTFLDPSPAVTPGEVAIDQTVWFGGFKLTLGNASLLTEDARIFVDIDTLFENQGTSSATLNATLNLSSGLDNYQPDLARQDLPEVPGLTTGSGTLSFDVDGEFSFDDAILTIGNAENNQALIPLGTGGTFVDLAPVAVAVKGAATGGELRVRVRGGGLRADIPDRHDQVEAGKRALSLDIDITYRGDRAGGYAFSGNNLALTLPDGTTVAVDDGPIELLRAGTTLPDQQVRFIVRDPAAGTYELVVIDDTTDERGSLTFEIT